MVDAIVKLALPLAQALVPWIVEQARSGKSATQIQRGLVIRLKAEATQQAHNAVVRARR